MLVMHIFGSYSTYMFNEQSGRFSSQGTPYCSSATSTTHSGKYLVSGSAVCKFGSRDWYPGKNNVKWTFTVYRAVLEESTETKGETKHLDVVNADPSAYPTDGSQDGYWYVYKGIE